MNSGAAALTPLVDGIAFGSASEADFEPRTLHPEEERMGEQMLPARRRDFRLGRSAGHRALAALGAQDGPILMDGRRPKFPSGWTGSLSHSAGVAVAIVAPTARARSVGIDLELRALPARAARLVLRPEELHCVAEGRCSCTEAFSAKEAAFKALSPLLGQDVEALRQLQLEPAAGGFVVRQAQRPDVQAFVSVRPLLGGVLAWTAIV